MVQKLQKEGHDFNCKFKFIMVGGSGVGKTAAILRFCDNKFNPNLMNTIGVDFKTKFVLVGHSKIKLQLWDTAGQEKFQSITQSYYKNSDACIAMFDITN